MLLPMSKTEFNDYLVVESRDAVNPEQNGTKAAAHYQLDVEAGETVVLRLRLSDAAADVAVR